MKKVLAFFLLFNIGKGLTAQQPTNWAIITANKLKAFLSRNVSEKAYLQIDRPYYLVGDTIYFKAYVASGEEHRLTDLSKVLHVDLVGPKNNIINSINLRLNDGVCWGDFTLTDSLSPGNYKIVAYTQWMRNSNLGFFEKIISVGSFNKKSGNQTEDNHPPKKEATPPSIQFFPEAGELVEGILTKIAFKAINANGLGIGAKLEILDNDDHLISTCETSHLGMGYFYLQPQSGKAFRAHVSYDDGSKTTVKLPEPVSSGIALRLNNDSSSFAAVEITANGNFYKQNAGKNFFVLIYSGGRAVTFTFSLDTTDLNFKIIKSKLKTGIATITLFSSTGEPLCERLLFVNNKDQLILDVQTNKTKYSKREKTNIYLNNIRSGLTDSSTHFSVSVIVESKIHINENNESNILTNLLLTSELRGYVEDPNYYFIDSSRKACEDLDVLMLTQGYRRFQWNQVLNLQNNPLYFVPELGLSIDGLVADRRGKPAINKTVCLMADKKGSFLSTVSDSGGRFHFPDLIFDEGAHFILTALDAKGKNSDYRLSYTMDTFLPPSVSLEDRAVTDSTTMKDYLDFSQKEMQEHPEYQRVKIEVLKEVKVRGIKKDNQYHTESLAGAGNADQVMHADEIEKVSGPLSTSLNGRLHGVTFSNGIPYLTGMQSFNITPMLIVIDGVQLNSSGSNRGPLPFSIDDIPSSTVESVEILRYANAAIYGMDGGGGVLIITTKTSTDHPDMTLATGILPIAPEGFYKAKEFYSPTYEYRDTVIKKADLRSTIFWAPEIKSDGTGKTSLTFYNSDEVGIYRIEIEGIDGDGKIGHFVYKYNVE
ncbi:MAG TPA: TonB-dependent receptor plug domain-containing protein [Puia sp.]|nr:TonB-dependent receptor plug domain-containing protein [Puia sp.]